MDDRIAKLPVVRGRGPIFGTGVADRTNAGRQRSAMRDLDENIVLNSKNVGALNEL